MQISRLEQREIQPEKSSRFRVTKIQSLEKRLGGETARVNSSLKPLHRPDHA